MGDAEGKDSSPKDSNPPSYDNFLFSASSQLSDNNEAMVAQLDELQEQIELLRATATEMAEKRDALTKRLTDVSESSEKSSLTSGNSYDILLCNLMHHTVRELKYFQ